MLNLAYKLDDEVICLVDGNASSLAMADFLSRRRKVKLLALINPSHRSSEDRLKILLTFAEKLQMGISVSYYDTQEEYEKIISSQNQPVCLPMDLNQVIGFYIGKLVKGLASFPPFKTERYIMPWVLNEREESEDYCHDNDIVYGLFYDRPDDDLLENVVSSLCDYEPKFMKIMKGRILNRVKRVQKR